MTVPNRRVVGLGSVAMAAAMLAGCGSTAPSTDHPKDPMPPEETPAPDAGPIEEAKPPPLPELERITLTLVAAEVAAKMKDGRPWDGSESKLVRQVQKPLLRYLELHPELHSTADTIGVPIDLPSLVKDARKDQAPDPMVFLEIGDHIFRSPARPRAFAPLWDFPITFAYGFSDTEMGAMPGTLVRIHVVDFDAPAAFDVMGTTVLSVEQLLSKPLHKLDGFGAVTSLSLQVKREPLASGGKATVHSLAVPGKPTWTDTGIELSAGQRLIIEAADEVCTTREGLEKCSGPEGQKVTDDNNLKGFEKLGHGALVGALGDTRFAVSRRLELVAPSSGVLKLGVNDKHYVNNRGSYAVRVTVLPQPVLTEPRNTEASASPPTSP